MPRLLQHGSAIVHHHNDHFWPVPLLAGTTFGPYHFWPAQGMTTVGPQTTFVDHGPKPWRTILDSKKPWPLRLLFGTIWCSCLVFWAMDLPAPDPHCVVWCGVLCVALQRVDGGFHIAAAPIAGSNSSGVGLTVPSGGTSPGVSSLGRFLWTTRCLGLPARGGNEVWHCMLKNNCVAASAPS